MERDVMSRGELKQTQSKLEALSKCRSGNRFRMSDAQWRTDCQVCGTPAKRRDCAQTENRLHKLELQLMSTIVKHETH